MLEELRKQADSASNFDEEVPHSPQLPYREKRFLGMTAFQRFFIVLLLFLIICILGVSFLVVAQKVMPGFILY
jgi:hypothetical protein